MLTSPLRSHQASRLRIVAAGAGVWALVLGVALMAPLVAAQKSDKPLSKNDVIELLEGDVPPERVAEVARSHGIGFRITADTEKDLRDAGADDGLIKALRELAPKPTSEPPASSSPASRSGAPILLIETTPGGAQVYIDDEPKATTSPEGRLRFSQLSPGEHLVRLSLNGYRDHEQKVELVAGRTQTITVRLEAASPTLTMPALKSTPSGSSPSSLSGYYSGILENQTVGISSASTVALRESGGVVTGCLRVMPPLSGSGVLSGSVTGGVASFTVSGPAFNIRGYGELNHDKFSGAYTARGADGRVQQGRFALQRAEGGSEPSATDIENCSTGTRRDVPNSQGGASEPTVATFLVAHDHGPPAGKNGCVGWMKVGNGMINFQGLRAVTNGQLGGVTHSFDLSVDQIREARRNGVYLAAIGGFHIRLKKGTNLNFYVVDAQGRYQPPDAVLSAIDQMRR